MSVDSEATFGKGGQMTREIDQGDEIGEPILCSGVSAGDGVSLFIMFFYLDEPLALGRKILWIVRI
ncbi:MAG: hypothetical protein N4A40_14230 [Tissierellales bacterium]|jgi:hypothetical protein|nr:hypothetical protein [Tissierellales bacterium]